MASTTVTISEAGARRAMKRITMTVHFKDIEKTRTLLRLGALFMRLGAWIAGLTYQEE